MWSQRLRSDRTVAAAARATDEDGRAQAAVPLDAGLRGTRIESSWRRSDPAGDTLVDGVVDATTERRDVGVRRGELARRDHCDGERGGRDQVGWFGQPPDQRDLTEEFTRADLVDAMAI